MTAPGWLVAEPIAHRGLHEPARGIFENTISAAEAAIGRGFAIECDVQLTRDGEAVVFHDFDLDRLTRESGPISGRSAAELGQVSVGGTPDTISTLTAFLDRIADRVPLVLEIKSDFRGDDRLTRRVVEVLERRTERVAIKSFDPVIVKLLRQIAPTMPRGIVGQSSYADDKMSMLGGDRVREMTDLLHWRDTCPDFMSWRHVDLPAAGPFLARELASVPIVTWTVRSELDRNRVAAYADQIVFEGFVPA